MAPRDPAAAEALFRAGRSLAAAHEYRAACAKFAESLRLDHAPGTLLNLADCEEQTGRLASAWGHFRELSEELSAADDRQPLAAGRAISLERRLPRLTVRLGTGLSQAAKITRDDLALGPASLDVALPVDPGLHVVRVSDAGHRDRSIQVKLEDGQSRVVVAEPGEPETGMPPRRIAGWATGGVGAVALATGAVFGFSALSKRSDSEARCPNGVCPDAASAATYDDARTQARISDVSLGVGLVAIAVASYLILTSGASETAAPPPARVALCVAPAALGFTW